MLLDHQNRFSDAQAITNATASSTYYIDTLVAGNAIAPGAFVEIIIHDALTTSDSGALVITVDTATSTDGTTGLVHLLTIPSFTVSNGAAANAAGKVLLRAPLPTGCLRYLFVTYTLTNNLTAGSFDAHIVLDSDISIDGK